MANTPGDNLDPTDEINLSTVKERAVKGVVVLTGRTFFLSIISLVATGLLTVFLDPSEFGIFWIVSAVVNFLAYFSDVGLAAALIQKKESPTKDDYRTTFLVQQVLVLTLLTLIFFGTPYIVKIYNLSEAGKILLWSLGLSLFFSSLKTIPSIMLERRLEFNKLVIPQIVENLIYNLVAVFLAWKGFGLTSFTIAILLRSIVGLVIIYILQPWLPWFALSKASLKKLLTYGVPYQANTLLATLKDDAMTAFLGTSLGSAGVGFLGWAQKWGQSPLRFFMDHVLKVTFPAFARMQDNKEELRNFLTRSIFFICILVFPSIIGLVVVAPILVQIIPKYAKWAPALLPLALVAINTIFAAVTTQLTNLLNAIGQIKTTFKLMVMWTVLTWLLVPLAAIRYGVVGVAAAYSIIGASSLIAIFIVRRKVYFSLIDSAGKPLAGAALMGVFVWVLRNYLPVTISSVIILISSGLLVYLGSMFLIVGPGFIQDIKKSFRTLMSRK